jgi:neopullulanase
MVSWKGRSLTLLLVMVVACALVEVTGTDTQATQSSLAPRVTKVEPPNWWAAHTINPVRLLVSGRHLHGARVTPTRPEIVPSAVVINSAGTYLFVSVTIATTALPGDYPLAVETPAGKTTLPFRLEAPLDPAKNFQGVTNDDVIYLIMPDRFANGDSSNDVPPDAPPAATNRQNLRAWHGGDFRGIIERLPDLKELGVTALWLNPWYDNWNGLQTCDRPWCPTTHYHGYHAIDYYGVEDRFGDLPTLRELVARAHALGLKVIQDQVANHVGSHHPWVKDPPLDNWFHPQRVSRPFRADLLLSPHASHAARHAMLNSWFNEHLPDMNQEEPEVSRYEIQNALWWIGVTGLDGIRQDTIQYMPRAFIRDLCVALHRQYPRLWMVGEVFNRDPAHTSFFMGGRAGWDGVDTELDSVFDFPLWQTSLDVFTGKKPVSALRDMLKYDALYPDPARLTTMVNNHDVRRFLSLEGGTLDGALLHTAFTLTVRGTPQLYYGDEIAMEGAGDPGSRRDFPGGFPGDPHNAFEASGRSPNERRMYEWTRDWLRLRREHPALRRGKLIDLAFNDESYLFARCSAEETVLIAINRAATPKDLLAPTAEIDAAEGSQLVPLLMAKEPGTVAEGMIKLTVPARTVSAWKLVMKAARTG